VTTTADPPERLATEPWSGGRCYAGYHLTEFPVPNGAHPPFITTGIDGNRWFTGGGGTTGNQFGRISPRDPSDIHLYPASSTNPAPPNTQGIKTGPDGNLWFAEYTNSAIGTFSPFTPNQVTEYKLPVAGAEPRSLINGPCDTIWFTDQAGYIGRVTLTDGGVLTGLTSVIGSGLTGDLQSLLGGIGDRC
jgi:virginiamycin B lyase